VLGAIHTHVLTNIGIGVSYASKSLNFFKQDLALSVSCLMFSVFEYK